jgi:hypothetical protein
MVLAVVLQIVGALLVVVACGALFGPAVGLLVAGLVVFAAGFAHERAGGS